MSKSQTETPLTLNLSPRKSETLPKSSLLSLWPIVLCVQSVEITSTADKLDTNLYIVHKFPTLSNANRIAAETRIYKMQIARSA